MVSLRVFFVWLVQTGRFRQNPAADLKQVATATRPAPRWLTRAQQAALFHTIQGNPRDMAIFGLMFHAGLRVVSEVCQSAREDIRMSERKGTVKIRQGKGNKFRELALSKTIRKVLADWLQQNPEGSLFPNHRDWPITVSAIDKLLAEYTYRAKLEEITPHCLRHAFSKNLLDLEVPLDQAAMPGRTQQPGCDEAVHRPVHGRPKGDGEQHAVGIRPHD